MRINKKINLRGSFPYFDNDTLINNCNNKEKPNLFNSLSMNNLYINPHSNREFGKEMKNLVNLTVHPNKCSNNDNIEEKIKYYKKINDELTNMLNNYDKNFFEQNKKIFQKIIKINSNVQKNRSHDKCINQNYIYEENKKCKKIKIENKEDKENKDNNISYLENSNDYRYDKKIRKNGDAYMEKIVMHYANKKGNNVTHDGKKNIKNDNSINNIINIESEKTEKNVIENKDGTKEENITNNNIDNNIENELNNLKKNKNENFNKEGENQMKKFFDENNNEIHVINNNPQEVDEYFEDIFNYIKLKENKNLIDPNYLKNTQKTINRKMRAILIDWLVDVHKKYKLKPETLYLTVNIMDRYLSKKNVTTINLQLVGVVSLLISSKYEDIHPPLVKDLADITDGAYVKSQLISMENQILSCLNFDLCYPTQWHFFEFYKKKLNLNEITFYLAWYLMELALIDINIINYDGSIIASTAIMLAMKKFNSFEEKEFENKTGYNKKDLENCAKDIKLLWGTYKNERNLTAVKRKFSHNKFFEVSKIKYES